MNNLLCTFTIFNDFMLIITADLHIVNNEDFDICMDWFTGCLMD